MGSRGIRKMEGSIWEEEEMERKEKEQKKCLPSLPNGLRSRDRDKAFYDTSLFSLTVAQMLSRVELVDNNRGRRQLGH